nr:venom protein [Lampona murina]
MLRKISILLVMFLVLKMVVAPPVDQKKKDNDKKDKDKPEELDDFGLEYGRYLQQVVQALEEDKEFAKKLENISAEEIKSGRIAKELEFVKHNVRSKLDELKRIEMDRLRKLLQEQLERTELGLDRKGVKIPKHLDIDNPHSFEMDDLKKLIQTATNDLEELDRQRREEFKKYELEKEAKYRESLKNMTDDEKKETEKHHQEMLAKHKDHPKVHHPGSKPQLEQVWEDQDHMPRDEFNPRTFFAFHDVNGDGHLDVEEVEAILLPEVKKLYNPNNEEDDPTEMEEEFHRMREHIFNETDKNKDHLISLEEFLQMTEQQDFQRDEGWKGLDEQAIYSEAELEEYMRQRQMEMHQQGYQQYPYADQRGYYDVGNAQQGMPPHINYQVPPGGVPPQPGYHGQQYGVPPQQHVPSGQHQQQYQAGHPQQFQGGAHQQQFQAGHPQQQQFQAGHPQQQQQFQRAPQQQFQAGHPQQQQFQGAPQQQFQAGHPQQQQFQGAPQQQFQAGHQPQGQQQQQFQAGQQVKLDQQGNQQFNSVPSQQVPDQKQTDKSNSINQIPNADAKPNVPQDAAPHTSQQQVPKSQS